MKYIKLFMLMAAVTLLGACSSDDDSWNSAADVTVGMQSQNMTVSEGKGIFNVPVVVNGETNGNVFVTVEVEEVGTNPAKEEVNYIVTDKTINITDGTGNVEIETVDDDDINDSRTFKVTIVDAKGAKISENASTTISLKDNDAEFYSKLQGKWKMSYEEDSQTGSWDVTITGASDENDPDYNKYLYVSGMLGQSWTTAVLTYNFDPVTKTGYVAFDNLGGAYKMADNLNFGSFKGCIVPFSVDGDKLSTEPIVGKWSEDFKTVTFDENGVLYGAVFNGDLYMGGYFEISKIKLTK
jgi:major membrane immunogen (membrane-anchored lipoprotein)